MKKFKTKTLNNELPKKLQEELKKNKLVVKEISPSHVCDYLQNMINDLEKK